MTEIPLNERSGLIHRPRAGTVDGMALGELAKERIKTWFLIIAWVTCMPMACAGLVYGYRWAREEIREYRRNEPLTAEERIGAIESRMAAMQRSIDDIKLNAQVKQ